MNILRILKHYGPDLALQMLTRDALTVPIDGTSYRVPNDNSEAYHLLNSTQKLRNLVATIPPDATRIVDLGANVGLFALLAARAFPNAEITCYEADPRLAALASENTPDNVLVHPLAVTSEGGDVTFYRSNASHQVGSLHKSAVEAFAQATEITVPSVPVLDVVSGHIDFLKVDIQGAEWELFKDFDFSQVRAAAFEISFLDPGALEMLDKLRSSFPHYRAVNPVHAGADMVFTR